MCGDADHDFVQKQPHLRILLKCYNNNYFLMVCINLSKFCDTCKQLEYLGSNSHTDLIYIISVLMFGIFLQAAKLYTSKQAQGVYILVTQRERGARNSGLIMKEFRVFKINSMIFFCETILFYHFLNRLSDSSLFLR